MTGLHTGHAWIRGNVAGMLARWGSHHRVAAQGRRISNGSHRQRLGGREHGRPMRRFRLPFGYLSQTAHRQFTDHLYATDNASSQPGRLLERSVRARRWHSSRRTTLPVHHLNQLRTRSFASRDDSMTPFKGYFRKKPFVNAAAARATGPRALAGPSLAADTARRVCRDGHAHGPRRRSHRRPAACAVRSATLVIFTFSDNGPHRRRRILSFKAQEASRNQTGSRGAGSACR
jgi:hypothetical protein